MIPWYLYVFSGVQFVPLIAGLRHGRALPIARRWFLAFAALGLISDSIALQFALRRINNLWLGYIMGPLLVIAVLVGLSYWHSDPRFRRGLRLAGVGLVIAVVALVAFVEDTSRHSLVRRPLEALLVVVASLMTLVTLAKEERDSLLDRDWFWISCGLTLRYGAAVAIDPLIRMMLGESREVVFSANQVRGIAYVIAYLLIARGIWCPVLPRPSSGRTSPVSSPSFSSSPR